MKSTKKSDAKVVDRNVTALREKAAELRQRMSAEKAAAIVSRLEDPSDSGDLSQQSHEEWLFLNRNSLEKNLLREVEEALRRVEQGSFGICQECEEPISPKRLQALPWAKFCVRCQELLSDMAGQS
ncbi:MAG TPA: TraR/DksA C4-type zinc finger protein [Bryobacteraceae bacterium]|jgi:DnaK suppressor protein|nr:TraR/DksA C4-type zinc finger protein [Bryobacteraceae bacterium]